VEELARYPRRPDRRIDTDIVNIHPRFVYGVLGPLLNDRRVQFVKGFYRRPLRVGDRMQSGGGRVTELTARPLLNLFYPELSGVIQPLAGEYGGRRTALEELPFFSGYGVETGLLIEVFERFGLPAIAGRLAGTDPSQPTAGGASRCPSPSSRWSWPS
jgi:glucosyl-3-phosphoglycerate synthase